MPDSIFGQVNSIGDLLSACGAMQSAQVYENKLKADQLGVTLGHYLLDEELIEVEFLRSVLICETLLLRRLTTYAHVLQALNMMRAAKMSIDAALNSVGWNRRYYRTCAGITDLLVDSGVIAEDVREALYCVCAPTEKAMLTLLLEREMVSDFIADSVLTLYCDIQKRTISKRQAIARLKQIVSAAASDTAGHQISTKIRLGEVLVAAGAVSPFDMISAVERGLLLNKEMGQLLVEDEALPAKQLEEALRVVQKILSSEVNAADGIIAIAALNKVTEASTQSENPLTSNTRGEQQSSHA